MTPSNAVSEPNVATPATGRGPRFRVLGSTGRKLLAVLTILAVVAGGYKLFHRASERVRESGRFDMPLGETRFTDLPIWLHINLLREVQNLSGLPDTMNTLEPDLTDRLRDAFAMHPWVREVAEVRIGHPATIRVKLIYREPVAVVRTVRGLEPVDRDAVLLPLKDLAKPEVYLTITGVRSTATAPAGARWEDRAVWAAAATAQALTPHHRTLGLSTLDVSDYQASDTNTGALYLLTAAGTRVKWGRPPDADYPGEVPTQDKIDRLLQYVADNGSLDAPAGPYEIDLTHWQEISIRPRGEAASREP